MVKNQKGFVEILLIILIIVAALFLGGGLFSGKLSAPNSQTADDKFCQPMDITKESPSIKAPSYIHNKIEPKLNTFEKDIKNIFPSININDLKTYKLIKAKIPFLTTHTTYFSPNELRSTGPNAGQLKCPDVVVSPDGGAHHHFCQWINDPVVPSPNTSGASKYAVLYPASWTGSPGWSSGFDSGSGNSQIFYADYQIIFLAALNSDNTLMTFDGKNKDGGDEKFAILDAYQQVRDDDENQATNTLPDKVFDCQKSTQEGEFTIISNNTSDNSDRKRLQLETFVPNHFDVERNWYYPMCKPAIYLYPQERTEVNVRLAPKGPLTFTLPSYPSQGWNVFANPDGKIEYNNASYPYLYYEADIPDKLLNKKDEGLPAGRQGFVQPFENLENFLNVLLPKLGLNENESLEFKKYWLKVLPKSNYYSITIVPKKVLDDISPLIIEPNPDNTIRVILYFEPLEKKIDLNPPVITDFKRSGFTVVEWGGLFKKDPSQTFSCLM